MGRPTPAHNQIFGLVGEKVQDQLPPIVMAPAAGLVPWLTIQHFHQPTTADLAELSEDTTTTILQPNFEGGDNDDEDPDRPLVSVQSMTFMPKAWAPYFLAPVTPWVAFEIFRRLLRTIPEDIRQYFDFMEAWLSIACVHVAARETESILRAKWQNPHTDRRMLAWMQRHTRFVNAMPEVSRTLSTGGLDPQMCFNKALETVAALKPAPEIKRYAVQRNCSASKQHARSLWPTWKQACPVPRAPAH
jgi:hypothetical protein